MNILEYDSKYDVSQNEWWNMIGVTRPFIFVLFARNWNILRMPFAGGMFGGNTRNYDLEHKAHNEKRRRYRERCIHSIKRMRKGDKISLIMSTFDLEELERHVEFGNVRVISSELITRTLRRRTERMRITFRK